MALSSVMVSCEDIYEGGEEHHAPLPVQLKATIQPYDRDLPESWNGGEELGMFMFASGEDNAFSSSACVRLRTDEKGDVQPVDSETMPLYPELATKVDFICFSPYSSEAASSRTLSLDVSTPEKAAASDYLYSDNARNKYPSLSPVKVQMKHVTCMVQFSITADANISDDVLKALNPCIEEVPSKGEFSLAEGKLTSSDAESHIAMKTDAGMTRAECLLLPAASAVTVRCNVDGASLRRKLGNMSFESGKLYKFDLHVTEPGFEITLREIEDWKVETFD